MGKDTAVDETGFTSYFSIQEQLLKFPIIDYDEAKRGRSRVSRQSFNLSSHLNFQVV